MALEIIVTLQLPPIRFFGETINPLILEKISGSVRSVVNLDRIIIGME